MRRHRVLVMGGAGFLGSHLCDRLIEQGDDVVVLDDLSTGDRDNVEHLLKHKRFTLIEHDVREPFVLPVDRIYNLACPASPVHYQADPVKTTMTSVLGTLHALHLAERCGARVFLASTSEVYGDPEVHPQPETYRGCVNPNGIRSCYDEGKRCAESLAMDFARSKRVRVRVARIFNTYGPRMAPDDGRVVSNFIVQALRGEDLTVYGNGSQTRSFCYVDDLVHGMMALMEHPKQLGPVNLGNPEEFTVIELAERVLELTASTSVIRFMPLPKDDPRQRRPVIDKAQRELGFAPAVPLAQGLARTVEYFRKKISASPIHPAARAVLARAAATTAAKPRGLNGSLNGSHPSR